MRFKRSTRPVPEIARELGVQAIVEGTVARAGDRLRVTARLVDGSTDKPLWADTYDRPLKDVLAIQAEVASAIGDSIRASVTPQVRSRLTSVPSTNSAAYDLYLRGRFHLARENPEELRQGIELLERAVEADPQFALAYAELARGYSARLFYDAPGETSLQERAFVAIERALALDPNLDTAHLARGLALWQPANHFPHERAIASYRRAIALNPSADEAHHQLGMVYIHIGLLDEASREMREALRLNPSNELARFREGVVALYQARYSEAADVFARTPKGFQPPLVAFQLADALFHLGRKAEARQIVTDYLREHPNDLGGLNYGMKALLAADAGDSAAMAAAATTAQDTGKGYGHFHHTAFTLGRAYAVAGRARDAVGWLRRAADDGYPCYPVFLNDSTLDGIRGDPGFQGFLAEQKTRWERFKQLAR
jgi:tetratricopeptide (TPR) repeat protein